MSHQEYPEEAISPADTELAEKSDFNPLELSRPDSKLMTYYLLVSLLTGPGIVVTIWPLLFKYLTLEYKFDSSGVSMRWGVLFRTEIYLTYRRVQDIHLTRNLLQRWLGLATVSIQTASGSAAPEMKIEGIIEVEQLRDYLYSQMRGAKTGSLRAEQTKDFPDTESSPAEEPGHSDETLQLLTEIRDQLQRIAEVRPASDSSSSMLKEIEQNEEPEGGSEEVSP